MAGGVSRWRAVTVVVGAACILTATFLGWSSALVFRAIPSESAIAAVGPPPDLRRSGADAA